MEIKDFLSEHMGAVRLHRNPNRMAFRQLAMADPHHMVRGLIVLTPNLTNTEWFCWPGHLSDHWPVIEQTGLENSLTVRVYGLTGVGSPGEHCEVEVTDTRYRLPTGKLPARWVGGFVQRFIARQKLFNRIEVNVWGEDGEHDPLM